jgi:hypothetical protein
VEQRNDPASKPLDATKATDEQRELQHLLEHKDDDPEAPGRHQDRTDVADET